MLVMELCGAFQNRLFLFVSACVSGILFALVWRKYEQTVQFSLIHHHFTSSLRETHYKQWLQKQNLSKQILSEETIRYNAFGRKLNTESLYLYDKVQVLCLIFVNSHRGAEAVKETWAKHCNIPIYFGRFVDDKIPVIKVPPVTSFNAFCYALVHAYNKYKDRYKWILVADDYTYVSIENLRFYIAPLNESLPYYLGYPVRDFSNLYNVGSAGIVLSYGSISLIHSMYNNEKDCSTKHSPSWYLDQSIGKVLQTFNVHPVDTRDLYLRGRFNPFPVETMLIPGSISVFSSYWRTSAFLVEEGMNCCSDHAITFHGLTPSKMYLMEYLLYHLAVFKNSLKGLGNNPPLNNIKHENTIMENNKERRQVGEAYVQLLNKDLFEAKKIVNKKWDKTIVKNIWNQIFGSKTIT